MLLPQMVTLDQMQTKWASILNPIISNPSNNKLLLKNISLATGSNVINHGLGKQLTGWTIVRLRASATVFDTQDTNKFKDKTLNLTASANVVCDIEVF
jgi:hypothetical protein